MDTLLQKIRACTLCKQHLPDGVRPVLQAHPQARILIAGQAPGRKVHESGIPFDDASGDRLRSWMGISKETFYDAKQIAILPMGFCYPGTGKSGDLAPRLECEPAWRQQVLSQMPNIELTLVIGKIELTLVIGKYAQASHFEIKNPSVTTLVADWEAYWPGRIPLPHPSPRNNIWLRKNPWFESTLLPPLKKRVAEILSK